MPPTALLPQHKDCSEPAVACRMQHMHMQQEYTGARTQLRSNTSHNEASLQLAHACIRSVFCAAQHARTHTQQYFLSQQYFL